MTKEIQRIITKDNKCSKLCVYYTQCGKFRNKEKRCPEWATKTNIEYELTK